MRFPCSTATANLSGGPCPQSAWVMRPMWPSQWRSPMGLQTESGRRSSSRVTGLQTKRVTLGTWEGSKQAGSCLLPTMGAV